MKVIAASRWMTLFLLCWLISGTPSVNAQTEFRQARQALTDSFARLYLTSDFTQTPPSVSSISFRSVVLSGQIWKHGFGFRLHLEPNPFVLQYQDIKSLEDPAPKCTPLPNNEGGYSYGHDQSHSTYCIRIETDTGRYYLFWQSGDDANHFAQALRWLMANGSQAEAQQEEFNEKFKTEASMWQTIQPKPAMPDEAHVHQVLAENAVREKNFDKAIDEYEAALEIFPTWPDGQSNVALICGETGDYDCAVEHMQDYLELVPGAPDAQAAKDKIIIWKDKLAQDQNSAASPAAPPSRSKR
jgi:tetratricopeptide (TPR) repeat protein